MNVYGMLCIYNKKLFISSIKKGIPATIDNSEWSTLIINGKGLVLLNNQPTDNSNSIEGIEIQSNSNAIIKILVIKIFFNFIPLKSIQKVTNFSF